MANRIVLYLAELRKLIPYADTLVQVALGGGNTVTTTGTQVLTNKEIVKRVKSWADDTRPIVADCDSFDVIKTFGLTAAFTVSAPSGTPTDCQTLIYELKDNGVARGITWGTGTQFISRGVTLPSTTIASKLTIVGFMYSTTTSTWDCIALSQEV